MAVRLIERGRFSKTYMALNADAKPATHDDEEGIPTPVAGDKMIIVDNAESHAIHDGQIWRYEWPSTAANIGSAVRHQKPFVRINGAEVRNVAGGATTNLTLTTLTPGATVSTYTWRTEGGYRLSATDQSTVTVTAPAATHQDKVGRVWCKIVDSNSRETEVFITFRVAGRLTATLSGYTATVDPETRVTFRATVRSPRPDATYSFVTWSMLDSGGNVQGTIGAGQRSGDVFLRDWTSPAAPAVGQSDLEVTVTFSVRDDRGNTARATATVTIEAAT